MSAAGQKLVALATEEFPDLTGAEKKLLCHAATGDPADYRGPTDAENDPNHAETWGELRTIRAKVIRWMCVDRDAISHVDPNGIRIDAARINGPLDLQFVIVPFALVLRRCIISDGVNLAFAETRHLSFENSSITTPSGIALSANGIRVEGAVLLRHGFRAEGEVRLVGATIAGDLDCTEGVFHNPGEIALRADGMTVKGRAFLRRGFRADGAVRLPGATINGALDCEEGVFHSPGKTALHADTIKIGGAVLLSNPARKSEGFRADGAVSLLGAMVAGDLNCQGGAFYNPGEIALWADGITVKGRAFLRQGFRAKGKVSLISATIAVNLDCNGGRFLDAGGLTLNASGIHVGGPVFLGQGFHAEGEVRLVGAIIGSDLDCGGGAFHNPGKTALQADGMTVKGRAFLRQGFQAEGAVSLISTTIAGDLDCSGGVFLNTNGNALNASWAHVDGPVFLNQSFHAEGEVSLLGATIAGFFNCEDGVFHNPGKTALQANGIKIGSVALLRTLARSDKGFRAEGAVSLISATVAGDLDCGGATFYNPGEIALDINGSQVGGGVFLRWGFRATGEVCMVRTTIGGHLDCGGRLRATGNLDYRGGIFCNPTKDAVSAAINADSLHTGGSVLLRWGFHAEGEVRLVGASIDGDLDCGGGTFHNAGKSALNMVRGQVRGAVMMWQGFRTEGRLSLAHATAGLLIDEEASWPASRHLLLQGFIYTTIAGPTDAKARRAWLERQPTTPFSPQPYQQLAKVLRETGHEAAAKRILIAQEKARRKHGELGWWARGWSMLLGATIGHGYRPWQALLWAVFWVTLGGILFDAGYDKEIMIPAKAEAYDTTKKTRQETAFYPAFNRWLYSLDTFVPIINFGQKDYWGPQVACNTSVAIKGGWTNSAAKGGIRLCIFGIRVLYLYRWLHIIVGWVLITLVVAGFTGLVRKE
jgi:hypothetical protein